MNMLDDEPQARIGLDVATISVFRDSDGRSCWHNQCSNCSRSAWLYYLEWRWIGCITAFGGSATFKNGTHNLAMCSELQVVPGVLPEMRAWKLTNRLIRSYKMFIWFGPFIFGAVFMQGRVRESLQKPWRARCLRGVRMWYGNLWARHASISLNH